MPFGWLLGLIIISLAGPCASTTMKLSCSQLVFDHIDPLIQPGVLGSPHLHQIVGGNSFNVTMDPATEPPSRSTCTSCTFLDDFSNYWTAVMYFQARNGTFMRAKQLGSLFHEAANGGITIYYFDAPGGYNITAFQKGFRMRNGDPTVRDKESASRFKGITYTCLARPDTRYTNVTSEELWPEDESQPFLWSFGDRTGYGHHGDYIFGWKGGSLQRAFDAKCKPILNCAKLPTQEISVANTCTKNRTVAEEVDGWLDELPGGVEVLG